MSIRTHRLKNSIIFVHYSGNIDICPNKKEIPPPTKELMELTLTPKPKYLV